MHSKLALIFSALFFLLMPPAQGQPVETIFPYTLQVASFPDAGLARQYAEHLSRAGETVGFGTFELAGRGCWTRVYIGSFKTSNEARSYGELLISRSLIAEYLIKTMSELQSLGRPHTVSRKPQAGESPAPPTTELANKVAAHQTAGSRASASASPLPNSATPRSAMMTALRQPASALASRSPNRPPRVADQLADLFIPLPASFVSLPVATRASLPPVPAIDAQAVPRADPGYLAINLIVGGRGGRGGLWVSGDCEEALARLRYIVGEKPELVYLGENGAVRIDRRVLAEEAGADRVPAAEAPLRIAEYIGENEGLLLLVQLVEGTPRYLLHIGRRGPALGGMIDIVGGVNLDNNYDSRINPYRRNGRKLDIERPPKGFDALVAINPAARWLNLRSNEFVSAGQITFHELAEAHAKVVMNLDYLDQDGHPGAHNVALDREERLKAQRPGENVVLTLGSNRLFKSEEEVRNFYTQAGISGGHQ